MLVRNSMQHHPTGDLFSGKPCCIIACLSSTLITVEVSSVPIMTLFILRAPCVVDRMFRSSMGPGWLVCTSAGLLIKRLWVQILAGEVGEFSSPELNLCADSYSVSISPLCYHSSTGNTMVILSKVQVAGYAWTRKHPWPNKVRVGWLCRCPGIVWEPIRKWAHTQLVREHSASHLGLLSHWSWHKKWIYCFKKKKKKSRLGGTQ